MSEYTYEMLKALLSGVVFALVIIGIWTAKDWMDRND